MLYQILSDIKLNDNMCFIDFNDFIECKSKYLILVGNIGNPYSKIYKLFFDFISSKFEKIFYILGSYEYESIYKISNNIINSYIYNLFLNVDNIILLNNNIYEDNNIWISGCVNWMNNDDYLFISNNINKKVNKLKFIVSYYPFKDNKYYDNIKFIHGSNEVIINSISNSYQNDNFKTDYLI